MSGNVAVKSIRFQHYFLKFLLVIQTLCRRDDFLMIQCKLLTNSNIALHGYSIRTFFLGGSTG